VSDEHETIETLLDETGRQAETIRLLREEIACRDHTIRLLREECRAERVYDERLEPPDWEDDDSPKWIAWRRAWTDLEYARAAVDAADALSDQPRVGAITVYMTKGGLDRIRDGRGWAPVKPEIDCPYDIECILLTDAKHKEER
jgi:hypothetical protein